MTNSKASKTKKLTSFQQSNIYNNNNDAWTDHRNQYNPFQTAREVAQVEQNHPHRNPYSSSHNTSRHPPRPSPGTTAQQPQQQRWQQEQHHQYGYADQNYHENNISTAEGIHSGAVVVGGGPFIPDSLKRKFQPPKKGMGDVSQQQHHQRPKSSNSSSKGGGRKKANYSVRPSSSNTNYHNTNRNQPSINSNKGGATIKKDDRKHEGDGEDQLPEELRHLDKELVKKIENEIMESGDTITFDDIAGLEDAKATVQEVVCWPMKRPDLFTGLRRAPNGLLLYGPPG